MRVLLLAWGVGDEPRGPSPQAAGLAVALAAAGHEVRMVTRHGDGTPALDGVEVHAVVDAPPIVPAPLREPALDALAFAGRATSVAVRRLEERAVDVVHAEGWATQPVVAALRQSHDVPVVAVVEPPADTATTPGAMAAALVADADVRVARSGPGRRLPAGVQLPARTPGAPPRRGPVLLAVGPSDDHRAAARRLRAAMPAPRRVTRSWARRPSVVVVLDPTDVDTVVRGLAHGVPVVAADGPAGEIVAGTGAGEVVADAGRAAVLVARLLADQDAAATCGAAARAAVADHDWARVATAWQRHATSALQGAAAPRLRAAR